MSTFGIFRIALLIVIVQAIFYFDRVNASADNDAGSPDVATSAFLNHPWNALWGPLRNPSHNYGSNLKLSRTKRNFFHRRNSGIPLWLGDSSGLGEYGGGIDDGPRCAFPC